MRERSPLSESVAKIIHRHVVPEEPWEDCPGLHEEHFNLADAIIAVVIQEPRRLHEEDLRLILEHIAMSTEALNRLTAAVALVGTNLSALADAIAAHPATTPGTTTTEDDSAQLTDLASKLEGFGQELQSIAESVNGPASDPNAGAGTSAPLGDTTSTSGDPADGSASQA
jgi:hypothetical protein